MKRTSLTICLMLVAFSILTLSSCTKTDITFDLPVSLSDLTYGPLATNQNVFLTQTKTLNLDSIVTANGGKLSNLKKIELKSLNVVLKNPASRHFDDFLSGTAYVRHNTDSVKIAFNGAIPTGTDSVTFNTQYSEFSSIVKQGSFNVDLVLYMQNLAGLPVQETIGTNAVFTLTVGPN